MKKHFKMRPLKLWKDKSCITQAGLRKINQGNQMHKSWILLYQNENLINEIINIIGNFI